MSETLFKLTADCKATIIPAGDVIQLPTGTEVDLVQNLGGSITVKSQGILYRIDGDELKKLDADQLQAMGVSVENESGIPVGDGEFSEQLLWDMLKTCFDPEIPINIVDLGLVYDLSHQNLDNGKYNVSVKMTLTAQGCGMGPVIAEDARRKIAALSAVESATVDIVWDPPWTPHMISPEGREHLGIS